MAIPTIAGLTLTEAWRKRTFLGALLLGALILAFSLLLILVKARFTYLVAIHARGWDAQRLATEYSNARTLIMLMCLFFIRILGMLFGLLLAGGAISGEIEAGLLSVILSKPVPRWQIMVGKWLGFVVIAVSAVLFWTAMVWLSISAQSGMPQDIPFWRILAAGPYLALYAVMTLTITLTFSTVYQRVLGTSIMLIIAIFSWCDGIFNFLGDHFNVPALHRTADIGALLMPQGYVAWWIHDVIDEIAVNPLGESPIKSSRFVQEWGQAHLHIAHLDMAYVVLYIIAVLLVGILLFERREIQG